MICLIILFCGVISADVQLQCSDITQYCLSEPVEYQCTVTGSIILRWRIRNETMTTLDTVTYSDGDSLDPGSVTDVPQFSTDLSSTTPSIVSTISFTVQSSINGYTIHCEDAGGNAPNCTIAVVDNPGAVTIHADSFTSSSVNISWTESPSSCNTIYNYTLLSSGVTDTSVMDITGSPTVVNGLVSSYERQYCVVVTAVDFSTRSSNESCFIFSVPPVVTNMKINFTRIFDTTVEITVSWEEVKFTKATNGVVVPDLLGYIITIANMSDRPDDIISSSSGDDGTLVMTTNYKFTGMLSGATYNITVYSVNGVGRNSTVNDSVVIPKEAPPEPSQTTFSSSVLHTSASRWSSTTTCYSSSSSSSVTTAPSQQGGGSSDLNILAIVGGVAGGVGGVAGGAMISMIMCCLFCLNWHLWSKLKDYCRKQSDEDIALNEKTMTKAHAQNVTNGHGLGGPETTPMAPTGADMSLQQKPNNKQSQGGTSAARPGLMVHQNKAECIKELKTTIMNK